jgi:D-3-phosphoglycerate dehydrogenase
MASSHRSAAGGRVLVTPRSLTTPGLGSVPELAPLRDAGYELLSPAPGRIPAAHELAGLLPGVVGWLAGVEPITAAVLGAAPDLRVISRNGTGTDAIDLPAAEAAGVAVLRAPAANAQGVAELAVTLALSALRGVPWSAAGVQEGRWERWRGRELADVRVGVLGLGAVGERVARLFTALGSAVTGADPVAAPAGVRRVGLDELVATSDVLTLHAPAPADGRPVLTGDLLATAPAGAVLVNTARASLVDDDAVLAALRSGRLSAYGVDAFPTEPPVLGPLLRHPRVLATPHIGGYTDASVRRATRCAVDNLLQALRERT